MKILLVDDDHGLLHVLAYVFRGQGYQVSTTCNGFPAVGEWQIVQPDIVVLDVGWPTPLGLDVLRRIQESETNGGTMPAILLTAIDDRAHLAESLRLSGGDLEANDLLLKPFRVRHLIERVQALTRTRHRGSAGLTTRSTAPIDPIQGAGAIPTGWWRASEKPGSRRSVNAGGTLAIERALAASTSD